MGKVYHGSPIAGLKIIRPSVSTHGKSYVYATKDRELALLFLQRWNDFIFNVAYGDDGILEVTERYTNALNEIYEGKSGFLYTLSAANFKENVTCFEGEVVSEYEETVIESYKVENILKELEDAHNSGKIRLRYYPDRHPDIPVDDSDLLEEAIRLSKKDKSIIEYCCRLHPHLRERINNEMI